MGLLTSLTFTMDVALLQISYKWKLLHCTMRSWEPMFVNIVYYCFCISLYFWTQKSHSSCSKCLLVLFLHACRCMWLLSSVVRDLVVCFEATVMIQLQWSSDPNLVSTVFYLLVTFQLVHFSSHLFWCLAAKTFLYNCQVLMIKKPQQNLPTQLKIMNKKYIRMYISVDDTPVKILASKFLVLMEMMKYWWGYFWAML